MKPLAKITLALWLGLLSAGCHTSAAADQTTPKAPAYKAAAGPHKVTNATYDWQDETRRRDVPVRIYYPETGEGPFPVIIFSHGLGGSRDGYRYLGLHWASHGYVSVHLQHKGSDRDVLKGKLRLKKAMRDSIADPRNAINRPLDVRFAIDQMEKMNGEDTPLKGRLDLRRVGMAGHSFGAWTTLAAAGQVFVTRLGKEITLSDPRVKAAIPMSAPPPRKKEHYEKAFSRIRIPCFHMTGTLDDSVIVDTKAADRRVPFDHTDGAEQFLVVFKDGDHMIFSGRLFDFLGRRKSDALFQNLIRQSSAAFWDMYLKGDDKARAWLAGGGFEAVLGKNGDFEMKLKVVHLVPVRSSR